MNTQQQANDSHAIRRRIGLLVLVHILLGALATPLPLRLGLGLPYPVISTINASVQQAQFSLLAFGLVFARVRWWWRIGSFALATAWFVTLDLVMYSDFMRTYGQIVHYDLTDFVYSLSGPVFCILANALVFLGTLGWRYRLAKEPVSERADRHGLQFSVFDLLHVITVLAIVTAWSKFVFWLAVETTHTEWAISATVGLGVICAWLVVGRAPTYVAVLASFLFAILFEVRWTGIWQGSIFMSLMEMTVLVLSFLVVRSCNYRLVDRRRKRKTAQYFDSTH